MEVFLRNSAIARHLLAVYKQRLRAVIVVARLWVMD